MWRILLCVICQSITVPLFAVDVVGAFANNPSVMTASEDTHVQPIRGRFTVSIGDPIIVPENDWQRLISLCGVNKRVYACTWFAAEQLSCDCERSGDSWVIVALAKAVPVMYLSQAEFREHEEVHINDVQESLRAHLDRLTSRHFKTAGSCNRTAVAESARFVRVMNEFRAESNRKYN